MNPSFGGGDSSVERRSIHAEDGVEITADSGGGGTALADLSSGEGMRVREILKTVPAG